MFKINLKIIAIAIVFMANFNCCFASGYWQISKGDAKRLESAIYFAEKGKWNEAISHARAANDGVVKKTIQWLVYRADNSGAAFKDITSFIRQNPGWPQINLLKRKAEESITSAVSSKDIINWFDDNPPLTDNGVKYYAYAKVRANLKEKNADNKEIVRLIKLAWIKGDYSLEEEADFMKSYSHMLDRQDYIARIDDLLWERKIKQARRIFGRVSADYQKLFNARIELIEKIGPVNAVVNSVPKSLRNNHGLLYDLAKRYDLKADSDKITEILKRVSSPISYQDKWWSLKMRQARELIQEKKYREAYNMIKEHNNIDGNDYSEAEWLLGWIALTHLGDKQEAYRHFYSLYTNVKYPISLARGAYWSGRANEGVNDQYAIDWYRIAARHPDAFYGQLATLKLKDQNFKLPPAVIPSANDISAYKNNELAKAMYLFAKNGRFEYAKTFSKAAIQSAKSTGEVTLISELGMGVKNTNVAVETAKHASREKNVFVKVGFPTLIKVPDSTVEKPLALSIIRQESVFDQRAESSAGAQGLMQLMPSTAKQASKELKLKFDHKSLKTDSSYNVKLGTYSLKKLIDNYDGSYVLAIAAYNAGPGNVRKWLVENGDPRGKDTDHVVNWIESIPFYETRNYVQRVLENLQVYRVVATNTALTSSKLMLDKDLKR
jgi:soluble lytic murein transglycosylase